jgi:hypothetical protein
MKGNEAVARNDGRVEPLIYTNGPSAADAAAEPQSHGDPS